MTTDTDGLTALVDVWHQALWIHEQDVRRAVGRPGVPESTAAVTP